MSADVPSLLVNGEKFTGWTELRITRGLERLSADVEMVVAGPWPGKEDGWPIRVFAPVVVRIDDDPVLTGFLDEVEPELTPTERIFRVGGRSKTADLVDCNALIQGGEFRDSAFPAICRAIARPFGLEVVDNANAGRVVIPTEAADQTETCFRFLERLARQANVLLTDDAEGRLVIARTGQARASGSLVEGENIINARMSMRVDKRFSVYLVRGQLPVGPAWQSAQDANPGEAQRPGADAQPGVTSSAVTDPQVPRYRPFVMQAEGNADAATARARAVWQARRAIGQSLELKITVQGWRQKDGRLWQVNEIVPVDLPSMGVRDDLLIAEVSHQLTRREGRLTVLLLGPPDAYTPEPAERPASGGAGWLREWRRAPQ
jgi:prophage tail gpP-like protein